MYQPDRSHGLPDWDTQLLALLGKLVVEWGQLEMLLHQTCWTSAYLTDEQGVGVSAGQDWRAEWAFLQGQIKLNFPHLSEDAAAFGQRLAEVAAQRERVMHGIWMPGDPAGLRLLVNRSTDRHWGREMSGRQLTILGLSISASREALAELHMRMQSGDEGGGSGVREPRRPSPPGDAGAVALPEDESPSDDRKG
jgi:hypothetical protein